MKSHISLTSVLAAVLLFAVAVVMHEAARADSLLTQGYHPVAGASLAAKG